MNCLHALLTLGLLASATHCSAQLTFSFASAQVDTTKGFARIDVVANASLEQVGGASRLGMIGQHTATIRFDLLGDLNNETLAVSAHNQVPYPTAAFFAPQNGLATVSDGLRSSFTVVGFGGVSFESLVEAGSSFPLLRIEIALDEFLKKDVDTGSIQLTIEDVGLPSPTSLGSIGSRELPFVNDPLYAIHPSGGSTALPTQGPTHTLVLLTNLAGDYDGDATFSSADIDILSSAIRIRDESLTFDLNGDNAVNFDDHQFMLSNMLGTLAGDTDLDLDVDFADFLKLSDKFGNQSGWSDGDFDGDGVVAFPDFLKLSRNFGKGNVAAVPESDSRWLLFVGWPAFFAFRRSRQHSATG